MKKTIILSIFCSFFALFFGTNIAAQNPDTTHRSQSQTLQPKKSRLTVGGYGEAVYSRHFYSDNVFRYSHPDRYTEAPSYGRVDIPHGVLYLGYDFGKGWSFGTEIEFEHGGVEAAVEKETEETGEFEQEIERGGEVALEQFWIQKTFSKELNIRMGHIVVPIGMTNYKHTPDNFFTVYRPEGENTIMPCTWHETGVSVWGNVGHFRYEAQIIPGLNSKQFNQSGWIHGGSASSYEFRPSSNFAAALRLDYNIFKGFRIGMSGYVGNSFNNDISTESYSETSKYNGVKGTVMIGTFDFSYKDRYIIARGGFDYGNLSDAAIVSSYNKNQTTMTGNPYQHTFVGKNAWAGSMECGVNLFAFTHLPQQCWLFAHYEHYDSYVPAKGNADINWADKQIVSGGINYCPIPEIALKAEYGVRLFDSKYNNEPYLALGITWSGFFKH